MFDRLKGMALVLYNNTDFAQAAVRETKGWKIGGNKIKVRKMQGICTLVSESDKTYIKKYIFMLVFVQVDFASQESQMAFYRSMQASGQDIREIRDIYEIPTERRYGSLKH